MMKLPLTVVGFVLLFSVQESTQQSGQSEAYTTLKAALIRGIADNLHHHAKLGVRLSKPEAYKKLKQLSILESVKNTYLFKQINPYHFSKVVEEALESPEVQKEYHGIMKGSISPRFIGATIMGMAQLASDVMTTLFTRYERPTGNEMPAGDEQPIQFEMIN